MFGFNFDIDIEDYVIETKLGNAPIQKQSLQIPTIMAMQEFSNLVNQVAQSNQPIKIKIMKYDNIYSDFDKKYKKIENNIIFANKSYMNAFPNEF